MNKFVESIKAVDREAVGQLLESNSKWLAWAEPAGKNALHYLCGLKQCMWAIAWYDDVASAKLWLKYGAKI